MILIGDILKISINFRRDNVQRLIANNETVTLNFNFYGGSWIKTRGYSPDAFVQMAFQLAHYRCYGRLAPTYESASTKRFFHGRTETGRSVSNESARFVKGMIDRKSDVGKDELSGYRNAYGFLFDNRTLLIDRR